MGNIEVVNKAFEVVGLPATCLQEEVGYSYDTYKCKFTSLVNKYTDKHEPMCFTLSVQKSKEFVTYPRYINRRSEVAEKGIGTMLMGIDMEGNAQYRNIQDTKSILIAGSSGGGKSVYMNNLILSLLDSSKQTGVDLSMIDLKQTELAVYETIQGVSSVATDYDSAIALLNDLKSEIAYRYEVMREKKIRKATASDFSIRVCFIDEYAMLTAINQDEVDGLVAHIASVGRACNVYLVIATQHPKADVISNLIKANIQSRVCLRTLNSAQSVSILGCNKGVNLLGKGDALMQIDGEQLVHVQGCFISDNDYQQILGD